MTGEFYSKYTQAQIEAILDRFNAKTPDDLAEYAPVVHGMWYKDYTPHRPYCSVCDYRTWELTKYCPNCGAKMDGDGNG